MEQKRLEGNAFEVEGSGETARDDETEGPESIHYNEEIQVLADQKEERDMLKEIIYDSLAEIEGMIQNSQDQVNINKLIQLKYVVEPSLEEIITLEKVIHGSMKKLGLKGELFQELKISRIHNAIVQFLLDKVKERER